MKAKIIKGASSSVTPQAPIPRRKKIPLIRCLLLAWMSVAPAVRLFPTTPLVLDLTLNGMKEPQPPSLVGDVLILSYKPAHPREVRFVGARFETEDYTVLHPFSRNQYGVYVLDYEVPEKTTAILYRLVVDGLWLNDPSNPETQPDDQGNLISLFAIEKEPPRVVINPHREADGSVTFVFRGQPGRRVTIQGDFNNWDPFVNQLVETEPGLYRINLRLLPGGHWYRFFTDGHRLLDRYNTDTGVDADGQPVSYCLVLPPPSDPE